MRKTKCDYCDREVPFHGAGLWVNSTTTEPYKKADIIEIRVCAHCLRKLCDKVLKKVKK